MKSRRPKQVHTLLTIEVLKVDVESEASVNYNLRGSRPIFAHDDDPAFEFISELSIEGLAISPSERADDRYILTLRGDHKLTENRAPTLKDFHLVDEKYGAPVYRSYHGQQIPVYKQPPGIATLNRRRGSNEWDAWIFISPRLISDMLTYVNIRPLYVYIHELKAGRERWIQSISLQTKNPSDNE